MARRESREPIGKSVLPSGVEFSIKPDKHDDCYYVNCIKTEDSSIFLKVPVESHAKGLKLISSIKDWLQSNEPEALKEDVTSMLREAL